MFDFIALDLIEVLVLFVPRSELSVHDCMVQLIHSICSVASPREVILGLLGQFALLSERLHTPDYVLAVENALLPLIIDVVRKIKRCRRGIHLRQCRTVLVDTLRMNVQQVTMSYDEKEVAARAQLAADIIRMTVEWLDSVSQEYSLDSCDGVSSDKQTRALDLERTELIHWVFDMMWLCVSCASDVDSTDQWHTDCTHTIVNVATRVGFDVAHLLHPDKQPLLLYTYNGDSKSNSTYLQDTASDLQYAICVACAFVHSQHADTIKLLEKSGTLLDCIPHLKLLLSANEEPGALRLGLLLLSRLIKLCPVESFSFSNSVLRELPTALLDLFQSLGLLLVYWPVAQDRSALALATTQFLYTFEPCARLELLKQGIDTCPHAAVVAFLLHQIKENFHREWTQCHTADVKSSNDSTAFLNPRILDVVQAVLHQGINDPVGHLGANAAALNVLRYLLIKDRESDHTGLQARKKNIAKTLLEPLQRQLSKALVSLKAAPASDDNADNTDNADNADSTAVPPAKIVSHVDMVLSVVARTLHLIECEQ
jgi:Uncharacterised protein family, YAP/Alf4/glomulin